MVNRRPRRFNALLSGIYENPRAPASFSSPYRLYKAAKAKNDDITMKDVNKWLSSRDAYTLHRDVKLRFPRRKILTRGIDYLWQADLLDYDPISDVNSNFRYLLTIIDAFSRYAIAIPLRNKSGPATTAAFLRGMKAVKSKPKKLQTDEGKEFYNEKFKDMLKENKIHQYSTTTKIKCAIVERFNRTLRSRIQKYMVTKGTLRYIDVLPDIVLGYNKTQHSSLEKYSPEQVNKGNEKEVFNIQYGEYLAKRKKAHKLKIGDTVRLSKFRKSKKSTKFRKGYERTFTRRKYTIVDTHHTEPPTYSVKRADGKKKIINPVYEEELQLVTPKHWYK